MIELKGIIADDSVRLTVLKSRYNLVAVKINLMSYKMEREELDALMDQLKVLEDQIIYYYKI